MQTLNIGQAEGTLTSRRPSDATILVLEDDADVRELWLEDLRAAGYTAVGVGYGTDALALTAKIRPALVVSDVIMPGMDGFEFLLQLRRNPTFAPIPVLLVSSLAEGVTHTLLEEFPVRERGITEILAKPVKEHVLIDRVRRLIGDRPEACEVRDAG